MYIPLLFILFSQASGVKVAEACKAEYQNLKMGRKYRYILYGLSDDLKEIVVRKLAEPGEPQTGE